MTSYPRPPNTSLQAGPQDLPELRPKSIGGLPTPASTSMTPQKLTTTNNTLLDLANNSPLHRPNTSVSTVHTPFDQLSYTLDDNFDYFSNPALDVMNIDSTAGMFNNDNQCYQSPSPARTNESSAAAEGLDSSQLMQHTGSDTPTNARPNTIFQYNTRLSKLNLDLSNRIEQYLNTPSESMGMLGDIRLDASNIDNNMPDHLFEQALNDLSEFLHIIQAYTTKRNGLSSGSMTKSTETQNTGNDSNQRISLVIFLNLISAYLQIITVYDKVLQRLSFQLFGGSLESFGSNMASAAGDVRMSGLTGTLRTKILVHAILHQFDVIERMLGLPEDLRVTDKQSTYSGLFEDDRARGLLGAVSNGYRIEHVWGQVSGDDPRTSKALSGLRESLRLVQAFLDA
jgi:hypothetical protein